MTVLFRRVVIFGSSANLGGVGHDLSLSEQCISLSAKDD